jgi:hypothetical protein
MLLIIGGINLRKQVFLLWWIECSGTVHI